MNTLRAGSYNVSLLFYRSFSLESVSSFFRIRYTSIYAYKKTGTMTVQAMDAFKSVRACSEPISANIRVAAYIAKRRRAPASAKICFNFFIRIILYI